MMFSFDAFIHRLFYNWGIVAYRYRWILLVSPIIVTMILGSGLMFIKKQTTIDPEYVFSPSDALWRREKRILSNNWPLDEQMFWPGKSYDYPGYLDIIAAGKVHKTFGRPNMLLINYLDELERINQYIINNITVPVVHNGAEYAIGFMDLCMTYEWKCYMNEHIIMLMPKSRWTKFDHKFSELTDEIIKNEVKITYPIGWRGSEPIYFGALVGAPHLIDTAGHFDYVRAIRLTYNVRDDKISNISYSWRKKVADYLSNEHSVSDLLEFGMYHNESLPEGLQQVADSLTPKFAITAIILFTVCGLSSIVISDSSKQQFAIDWVRSKPIITVAGLFCPLLAIVSAFGFILWTGSLYNAIVNVSPFIVFCIGVDDMFIMSAAWHRSDQRAEVAQRMAAMLSEAAVAISITSFTDMITFAIGSLTTLPSVQMFCFYTLMGVTFTYIYQLTFFTAVMAFSGEREAKGLHALTLRPALDTAQADTLFKRLFLSGTKPEEDSSAGTKVHPHSAIQRTEIMGQETSPSKQPVVSPVSPVTFEQGMVVKSVQLETFISRVFRETYGPFLLAKSTKKAVLFIYVVYLSVAILGCSLLEEGLNPKFLVLESFYLNKFYVLMDETFWQEGLQMQVVVNSPPNLFNITQREQFREMLTEFEGTEYTMAHNATMLWLDAFEKKLNDDHIQLKIPLPNSSDDWYQRCREWLIIAGGRRLWEKDLVWNNTPGDFQKSNDLLAFRFQIGLRNYKTPTDHMRSAILMRTIAAKHKRFNITTFHEYYPFADQYIELKPALIRNCVIALMAMFVVSLVMIPSWMAALTIAGAIVSIDIGVIGFMTFWGVRLESVSMITVIMSIGFAVDLSAHIGYAYVKAEGDKDTKAIHALQTLGWPVFLGAFSTMLGIMVLATVNAYIVQIFFKTIFLVIIFSMAHGLVLLPVLLTIILPKTKSESEQ